MRTFTASPYRFQRRSAESFEQHTIRRSLCSTRAVTGPARLNLNQTVSLFSPFPPVQTTRAGQLTPRRQINSHANQKPTDAERKMKSTIDLGLEQSAIAREPSPPVGEKQRMRGIAGYRYVAPPELFNQGSTESRPTFADGVHGVPCPTHLCVFVPSCLLNPRELPHRKTCISPHFLFCYTFTIYART
jgi:hypothetical protein